MSALTPEAAREVLEIMRREARKTKPFVLDGRVDSATFMRETWSGVPGHVCYVADEDPDDLLPAALLDAAAERASSTTERGIYDHERDQRTEAER